MVTLHKPHQEPGEGHESQGVRAQVGQEGRRSSDDRPRGGREEQDALAPHSGERNAKISHLNPKE